MKKLIFLLEEPSICELLNVLLPQVLPEGTSYRLIPHEGKSDLERSIPRKMRGWNEPDVQFIVMRDNDGGDCRALKAQLVALCREGGRPDSLVRIVCQQVESWYLGDLHAIECAFGLSGLAAQQHKAKYRDPDRLTNSSDLMKRLVKGYGKIMTARALAPHFDYTRNRSVSLRVFIDGVCNRLLLNPDNLLKNVQAVQVRNEIEPSTRLETIAADMPTITGAQPITIPNFSEEMETGTGKTYVYPIGNGGQMKGPLSSGRGVEGEGDVDG